MAIILCDEYWSHGNYLWSMNVCVCVHAYVGGSGVHFGVETLWQPILPQETHNTKPYDPSCVAT